MNELIFTLGEAITLLFSGDADLYAVIALSLQVSLTATILGTILGGSIGAWLGISKWTGRDILVVILNASLGLPPVVVGLVLYLLLSRAGPLGEWGLLFTPTAMIMAQTVLISPIIAGLTRQIIEDIWEAQSEPLRALGASRWQVLLTLLWEAYPMLLTVVLAGLGRALSEVGAVIIVGGNILGLTRVMTTSIALETSKGDLPRALALGAILLFLVLALNFIVYWLRSWGAYRVSISSSTRGNTE